MGGGRLRRPPLIKLSILYGENPKIYTKQTKNMQIHKNTWKNLEKYMKKCYVRVGNRTLASNSYCSECVMCTQMETVTKEKF